MEPTLILMKIFAKITSVIQIKGRAQLHKSNKDLRWIMNFRTCEKNEKKERNNIQKQASSHTPHYAYKYSV